MPQGKHSRLQKRLIYRIESVVLPNNIAAAFPELRCSFGGHSIVPDIAILKTEHIPLDDHGCQMGWLLDPDEKTVIAFPQDERSRCFEQPEALLPVPDWAAGLDLTVGELFG